MPKDEIAPEDPMMLTGVALPGDRTEEMARCLIEEYLMMGYREGQLLELFRNPFYTAPHAVYQARGETFVKDLIAEVRGDFSSTEVAEDSVLPCPGVDPNDLKV